MYCTKRIGILHMPKTGGTWIKNVLASKILMTTSYRYHNLFKYRFIAIRDPESWYLSLYNFMVAGSEITSSNLIYREVNGLLKCFGEVPSLELFTNILCGNITSDFQNNLNKHRDELSSIVTEDMEGSDLLNYYVFLVKWMDSGKSLYQFYYDILVPCATHVGQTNSLKEDLINILDIANELTPKLLATINSYAPINISKKMKKSFLDEQTILIKDTHKKILECHTFV